MTLPNTPDERDIAVQSLNMDTMRMIARNDQSLEDIKMLTSSKVTDQLKVFLVAQARNELMRVIKLTQFLDKLENQFISKVDSSIEDDDLTLKQYSDIIGVITSLLSRSNDIIANVLKDDSLMTILNTTIYSNTSDGSTTTAVVAQLKDSQSRERVRVVLGQILTATSQYTNVQSTETNDNTIVIDEEGESHE